MTLIVIMVLSGTTYGTLMIQAKHDNEKKYFCTVCFSRHMNWNCYK